MSPIAKIIIALVIGGAAWGISVAVPAVPTIALFLAATVIAALLPSMGAASSAAPSGQEPSRKETAAVASGPREEGSVKWFNVSKGFGFITKDNGDEIFVHFRSIRGEGRRSLRDGQRVSFVEAQSDKGPQAEDVEPL